MIWTTPGFGRHVEIQAIEMELQIAIIESKGPGKFSLEIGCKLTISRTSPQSHPGFKAHRVHVDVGPVEKCTSCWRLKIKAFRLRLWDIVECYCHIGVNSTLESTPSPLQRGKYSLWLLTNLVGEWLWAVATAQRFDLLILCQSYVQFLNSVHDISTIKNGQSTSTALRSCERGQASPILRLWRMEFQPQGWYTWNRIRSN